ncbi:MAG: hypothetical protein ACERKN_03265 [Velocimicrobium sp.]
MSYKAYKGKRFGVFFVCTLAFLFIVFMVIAWRKQTRAAKELENGYQAKVQELKDLKDKKEQFVYVLTRDIKASERISSMDVSYEQVYSSMDESMFATIGEEYKVALIDLPKGTQILDSMLSKEVVDSHIREEAFNVFYLSRNLEEYDVVDIRIFYPTGENYIVLSKKVLKGISQETANCRLWLDEQETLLISSAIVDAYRVPGAYLYTTKYVEHTIQEASVVTYTPSAETIDLIEASPNILELAKLTLHKSVRNKLEHRTDEFIKQEGDETILKNFTNFVNQGIITNEAGESNLTQEELEEEEIIYVD